MRGRLLGWCIGLLLVLAMVAVAAVLIGAEPIGLRKIWMALSGPTSQWDPVRAVVLEIRLPRVLLAGLVGLCLASAGVGYQGLLRNPLADPYIVGVSAGGALGAAAAIYLRLGARLWGLGVPACAFVAAILTIWLVLRIAREGRQIPVQTFLLAGVIVGSMMWALVSLVMILTGRGLDEIVFWLMGSLWRAEWLNVWLLLPFAAVGLALLLSQARAMNAMALGEESARHLGIDVERSKKWIIGAGTLLTAASVCFSGIIGFVGLVVPHICRLLIGPDARLLLPVSALVGALFLILADTFARSAFGAMELPVGIVTALLGAPFFCLLLMRQRRTGWM